MTNIVFIIMKMKINMKYYLKTLFNIIKKTPLIGHNFLIITTNSSVYLLLLSYFNKIKQKFNSYKLNKKKKSL